VKILWMSGLVLFSLVFVGITSLAAVPKAKVAAAPTKILQGTGALIGGAAGTGFSLLDIRKTQDSKKKIERIVMDIGDLKGQNHKGLPGYYHVQLLQNPDRLILDFSQMPVSKLTVGEIQKRLGKSMFVKSSKLAVDPVDQSLNMVFYLKNSPKAKVFQVSGADKTSKVVLDLML